MILICVHVRTLHLQDIMRLTKDAVQIDGDGASDL